MGGQLSCVKIAPRVSLLRDDAQAAMLGGRNPPCPPPYRNARPFTIASSPNRALIASAARSAFSRRAAPGSSRSPSRSASDSGPKLADPHPQQPERAGVADLIEQPARDAIDRVGHLRRVPQGLPFRDQGVVGALQLQRHHPARQPLRLGAAGHLLGHPQTCPSRMSGSAVSSWNVVSFDRPFTGSCALTLR